MSSSESDPEDQLDIQEALLRHLGTYLDEQIGGTEKKKKKIKTTKKVKSKDNNLSGNVHTTETVNKIKELTGAVNRQKLLSKSSNISTDKDVIKKMRQLLDRPVPSNRPSVQGSMEESDEELDEALDDEDHPHELVDDGDGFDEDMSDNTSDVELDLPNAVTGGNKQLERFKNVMGITREDVRRSQELRECVTADEGTSARRVSTIATLKGKKTRPPPTLIVFDERRPKKKKKKELETGSDLDLSDGPEFDLNRTRFEVRKFGISGLHGSQKEAGMADLLIKLGAKAPKRENTNYKDLQQQRKQEMQQATEKRVLDRSLGFKVVNPNKRKRSGRRDRNDVGVVDGQIGSYRGGVQVVAKRDIRHVTHKKQTRR